MFMNFMLLISEHSCSRWVRRPIQTSFGSLLFLAQRNNRLEVPLNLARLQPNLLVGGAHIRDTPPHERETGLLPHGGVGLDLSDPCLDSGELGQSLGLDLLHL